jgi:hypothetical protein
VNPDLLFVGTEFGLFFTSDGGRAWTQLKGGMPVAQVRDLTIQRRENDVVMGTFGRGFYVLDDYTSLREITPQTLAEEARLFPLRHAYSFSPGGLAPAGAAGVLAISGNYATPNPPVGAYVTYHVRETYGPDIRLVLSISNAGGDVVRRCELDKTPGLRRIVWNLSGDGGGAGGRGGGRGGAGRGGGRGGGGAAAGRGGDAAAADTAATAQVQNIPGCGGNIGRGGAGGRGGGGGGRVPNGAYRASIGRMVGTTFTQIGPSQTFMVMPLLEP